MNFLFISEILPTDTYASEIVFYRHFSELVKKGHSVHILTDQNSYNNRNKDLSSEFSIHIVPNRKWFYLPFKPFGILQNIRFYIYYLLYVRSILRKYKIDKIIGYVHGNFLLAFSAFIKKKTHLQLISFLHDDPNEINRSDSDSIGINTIKILSKSDKVLVASDSFKENWPQFKNKFYLLYPIPGSFDCTVHLKSSPTKVGYSGTIYDEIIFSLDKLISILETLKIDFDLIGNNNKSAYLQEKYNNVQCIPLFPTSNESNEYLINNCRTCVIAYPENIDQMPWIRTCFPSKFIQYCLLGIPSIIIAPKKSAIGKWCIENNWILYSENYDNKNIEKLIYRSHIDQMVFDQVEYFKNSIFNPLKLQSDFEELLIN
ncbi:glycosyltransferase [Pedobacter riviphilus]|uniref:Glycosyltransferase n=1 Tax=Pedobacter riviphilus TaxID=2766984 RepID=A0ABX6TPS5_9SPHI|nr:glycosyltransferase [Pedobacter riviphilus]QNR85305.1 glycosyltransferase [Pedobacter riviphilus]